MRYIITLLALLSLFPDAQAQNGFMQAYDLGDGTGSSFHHILLKEDTLILAGETSNPNAPQWGVSFTKMDTLGNILDNKVHFDSIGWSYSFDERAKMISTSDGGYAMIGRKFSSGMMFFKFDVNGNKEFFREYRDTTTFLDRPIDIVEIQGGYIYVAIKQQMIDYMPNVYVMHIDYEGNVIWEIDYGVIGWYDIINGITKISENEYLLTGNQSVVTIENIPNPNDWLRPLVLRIDTLGNILSTWTGELTTVGMSRQGLGKVYSTNDSGWVSIAGSESIEDFFGQPALLRKPGVRKWDSDFNLVWETFFGEFINTGSGSRPISVTPTPDEGWVGVGIYTHAVPEAFYEGYYASIMYKVNAEGDSLWSRTDTIFSPAYGAKPILESVVALPSGSIITCGKVDRQIPTPVKSIGWIMKVDKHGCIEAGCNPISSLNIAPLIESFDVFPNPTDGQINIKGEGKYDVVVYGIDGKIYFTDEGLYDTNALRLKSLSSGIYFVRIKQENKFLTKKIIVR